MTEKFEYQEIEEGNRASSAWITKEAETKIVGFDVEEKLARLERLGEAAMDAHNYNEFEFATLEVA